MKKIYFFFVLINLLILQHSSALSFAGYEITFTKWFGNSDNVIHTVNYQVVTGNTEIPSVETPSIESQKLQIISDYNNDLNNNSGVVTPSTPNSWIANFFKNTFANYSPAPSLQTNNQNTNPSRSQPSLNTAVSNFGSSPSSATNLSSSAPTTNLGNGQNSQLNNLQEVASGNNSKQTQALQQIPENTGGGTISNGTWDGNATKIPFETSGKYEFLADDWTRGSAGNFGCNDSYAANYFGNKTNGNHTSTSMQHLSKLGKLNIEADCKLFLVSLPLNAQKYYFGNLGLGELYKKGAGTPIEIINLSNKTCTVAPLWETGPGPGEGGCPTCGRGGGIDLTNAVKLLLGAKIGTNFVAQYRPVKTGTKGCEGYNFVDPNGKGLNIPVRNGSKPALTS